MQHNPGDPLVATQGNRNVARNSFNLREERGNSDYDLRQRLALNWVYELPFGKGKRYLSNGILATVLGGWEFTGFSALQSGRPFSIYSPRDSEYTALSNRPDLVGDPSIPAGSPRTQTGPPVTAFARQAYGRPGTLGRNVFTGPAFFNTDASLIKNTRITETLNAQFRAEIFNVLNQVHLDQPGNNIGDPGTFGISTTAALAPDGTPGMRQIQLALKLIF